MLANWVSFIIKWYFLHAFKEVVLTSVWHKENLQNFRVLQKVQHISSLVKQITGRYTILNRMAAKYSPSLNYS
jgi:hypothetical protein